MNSDDLIKLAPTILSFLGPLGTAAGVGVEFLADKLGLSDKSKAAVTNAIQGMTADQTIQLRTLEIQFQEFCKTNDIQVQLAQIAVNTEEAKNSNWFVAAWRPFVGWTCGVSLAYVSVIEPIGRFIAQVGFKYSGAFPVIDTTITMQVLLGLLGLAGMRTYDKKNGTTEGH